MAKVDKGGSRFFEAVRIGEGRAVAPGQAEGLMGRADGGLGLILGSLHSGEDVETVGVIEQERAPPGLLPCRGQVSAGVLAAAGSQRGEGQSAKCRQLFLDKVDPSRPRECVLKLDLTLFDPADPGQRLALHAQGCRVDLHRPVVVLVRIVSFKGSADGAGAFGLGQGLFIVAKP